MTAEMYEILSLFARYFFAILMVVIVFRAWRITVRDNRRAKFLRDWADETGCIGEFVINPKSGMPDLVPILREGILGSSPSADMHIQSREAQAQHAHIEAREGGLLIRPIGGANIAIGDNKAKGDQLFAHDGDMLYIGKLKLMVVLFEPDRRAPEPPKAKKAVPKKPQKPEKPKPERKPRPKKEVEL